MGKPCIIDGKDSHENPPCNAGVLLHSAAYGKVALQGRRVFRGGLRKLWLLAVLVVPVALTALAGCARHGAPPEGTVVSVPPATADTARPDATPAVPWVELDGDAALVAAGSLDASGQSLASWRDMAPAIRQSIAYLERKDTDGVALDRGGLRLTWGDLLRGQRVLLEVLPRLDTEPGLLARHFRWLRLDPPAAFTGYYEPVLDAARKPSGALRQPLYRVPDDMKSLDLGLFNPRYEGMRVTYRIEGGRAVPYHDRAAIDGRGALRGRGYELAWVDPVDAFFLQVQGSGRLRYADGSTTHVLYAGQNGRPYVSLGRVLRERGHLPADGVNMDAIRAWLAAHPERAQEMMNANPSYVFFRLAKDGPLGSMGRPLMPWVSLAVDRSVIPLGAITAFAVDVPGGGGAGAASLHGLGLAQDTGGAIKGHRIDLFCGAGERAKAVAGHLDARGQVWLLLPR